MTTFDKREEGFEKQFAHDEEVKFKATSRRNKLFGLWAAEKLGYKVAVPVFEEVDESKIWEELERAGLPKSGKAQLFDGRSGEPYSEKTVVGIGYILKLIHMVEDKTHEDITRLILLQVIADQEQFGRPILSTPLLETLIRCYGNSLQTYLSDHLEKSVETFVHEQEGVRLRGNEGQSG